MALPAPTHDESSRFDLIEGVRSFNYRRVVSPLIKDYPRRVADIVARGEEKPATKEDAGKLYTSDPQYLFACAVQRAMQRLAWSTALDSVDRDRETIAAGLRASAADERHSRLELAPDRDLPDWYTEHDRAGRDDIHLVAGGYWRDELVGPVYERGGAVYRLAWRDGYGGKPGALEAFARSVPPGNYRRVLDLGCSFGALTRALRAVFTDAEVTGIDLSAPALTYAHQLAAQQRQDITYAQRDAAATGYADASFDLIGAFLLLHEVPDDVRTAIVAEAFRLLRPGGRLIFLDIPPYRALEPVEAFFQSFDGRGNGENFWESFLVSDFPAVLAAAGFTDVTERALDFTDSGYWGSAALWRTGQFRAVHRWVTTARRPGPADEAGGRP